MELLVVALVVMMGLVTAMAFFIFRLNGTNLKYIYEAQDSKMAYLNMVNQYNALVREYNALKNRPTSGSVHASIVDPKIKERATKLMELAFSKANTNEARVAQSKLRELITKEL